MKGIPDFYRREIFQIETPLITNKKTKDWDILILDRNINTVIEVKSGEIKKEDRRYFCLRLREILNNDNKDTDKIAPVLVVDPGKKPVLLDIWRELSDEDNFNYFNQITLPSGIK